MPITTADTSLWDDSELLQLYEKQLALEKAKPLSQTLNLSSTVENSSKSDDLSSGSSQNKQSSSSCDDTASSKGKTLGKPQELSTSLIRHFQNKKFEDIVPLLNAYYDAGFAAGVFYQANMDDSAENPKKRRRT